MVITCERFEFETNISENLGFPRECDNLTVSLPKYEFILKEEQFTIPSSMHPGNIHPQNVNEVSQDIKPRETPILWSFP